MDWKEYLKLIYFDVKNFLSYLGLIKIYCYLKKEGKYNVGLLVIK